MALPPKRPRSDKFTFEIPERPFVSPGVDFESAFGALFNPLLRSLTPALKFEYRVDGSLWIECACGETCTISQDLLELKPNSITCKKCGSGVSIERIDYANGMRSENSSDRRIHHSRIQREDGNPNGSATYDQRRLVAARRPSRED